MAVPVASFTGSAGWRVFRWLAIVGFVIFTVQEAWRGQQSSIIEVADWIWNRIVLDVVAWIREKT